MRYCKRCLYPENHPLGLIIDEEGICSGCRIHEEKDILNWSERKEKLRSILEPFRSKSGRFHDCIVPVSGAKDSHFIVDTLKNEFGMNPLLVSYNKHYNTQLGIRNLAYLRTWSDGDFISMVVNPEKLKKITKTTLREFGSMYWHCLAGETVYPVQTAVKLRIPLIIWGAHQGLDQVGMFSHLDEVEMSRRYRKDHDLMGYEAEDLLELDSSLTEDDVCPFLYPDDNEIASVGVRGLYLGNYFRWDSKKQHDQMIDKYNYQTNIQQRTFDNYNHVDCFHYSGLHDYLKMLKHGYGKATDHASREIRLKRLSRSEGIDLVKKYTKHDLPSDLEMFANWLGEDLNEIKEVIETHRNPRLWENSDSGWKLRFFPENQAYEQHSLGIDSSLVKEFKLNKNHVPVERDEQTLIGKGFVLDHGHYVDV